MILSLRIDNFRGFARKRRKLVFCRPYAGARGYVTSIVGKAASGKSTVVSALELLQAVARGKQNIGQLHYGEVAAISSCLDEPCEIVVRVKHMSSVFEYGLKFEYGREQGCWLIENEWLLVGRDEGLSLAPVFARVGRHVEIGGIENGKGSYEQDQKIFVLSTFSTADRQHPLSLARFYLANLFIFGDKIGWVDARVPHEVRPCFFSPRAENLGAWLSYQTRSKAEFYNVLANSLRHHLPRFDRLVITREQTTGPQLSVAFKDSESDTTNPRVVPMWMLSTVERTILFGTIIATIGTVFAPVDCVCDDFDLFEKSCPLLAGEIGHIYAQSGHFVGFHKKNFKLFQNNGISLSRETDDE